MTLDECFKIGYVAKTHGLKGEVTVMLLPECPDLEEIESVYVQINQSLVPHFLNGISIRGDKAFIKFDDIDSIEEASTLKGCSIYLEKKNRVKLSRGEFYNDEVIGFAVRDTDGILIGNITEIFESGLNRFLMLDAGGKEVMIPLNGPFVKSVSKSKKQMTVELPEGFLDL